MPSHKVKSFVEGSQIGFEDKGKAPKTIRCWLYQGCAVPSMGG